MVRDNIVKNLLLACLFAVLAGCASSPSVAPTQPSPAKPSNQPARFDYERDDDLDQDLSRAISSDRQNGIA